jgi:hypothetical protein
LLKNKNTQKRGPVKVCVMPKPAAAAEQLPASAAKALRDLGENLGLARQRRKESLRAWASRMAVSVPTLIRMEKGDPSVGMGVYATALWLMGRHAALPDVAAPAQDLNALQHHHKIRRLFLQLPLCLKPKQAIHLDKAL